MRIKREKTSGDPGFAYSFKRKLKNLMDSGEKKRKRVTRAGMVLAGAIAFTTTYALILPAVTLDGTPQCGKEEHVHTEACYSDISLSEISAEQMKQSLLTTGEQDFAASAQPVRSEGGASVETPEVTSLPDDPDAASILPVESTQSESDALMGIPEAASLPDDPDAASILPVESTQPESDTSMEKPEAVRPSDDPDAASILPVESTQSESDASMEKPEAVRPSDDPDADSGADGETKKERHLICGLEEHQHSRECYPGSDAQTSASDSDGAADRGTVLDFFRTERHRTAQVSDTSISAEYDKGVLPDTVSMKARAVDSEDYSDLIEEVTGKEDATIKAFDISFRDGSKEIEPDGTVKMTFKADFIDKETTPEIIHITDDGQAERIPADIADGRITLTAESFSVYAIVYTVDFHYGEYSFSIPGGTFIWLSDVLEELHYDHVVSEFEKVEFSDESLINVEYAEDEKNSSDHDWRLTSLKAFSTDEVLTMTARDGTVYRLDITDASGDSASNTYHTNLADLLVPGSMKFYVDGEEVNDDSTVDVRDGMLYDLTFTLKESGTNQFSNEEQMYFQLPEGFVLPDDYADTLTINLGLDGKVYGNQLSYDKTNNRLLLNWNKLDRKYQRLIAAGNLRFTLHLQGYIKPGEVKYGDAIKFTANRYDPHNASVTKTGVLDANDLEHQKITYTVKVMSDGSTRDLTLTDVPGSALNYVTKGGFPSVTWARESTMSSQADERRVEPKPVGSDSSESEPYIRNAAEGFLIHIPETHDGDILTFTYTADVDYTKIAFSGNASFDEMGNTVQIYGDDDPVDNKSVFHQKEVAYSDLVKSVSDPGKRYKEGEKEYQNLTWTIDTNSYKMISFRGTEITDHITVYEFSQENPAVKNLPTEYISDGITIEVYEWNDDKSASVLRETRNIPWSELSVADDLDATKGWTYHVPEDDGIYEYKITYQTRSDVTGMTALSDVHNTATSKGGTDEVSKLLHPKGSGLGVRKRAIQQTEDDVTWEITVSLNDIKDGFNQRLVVEDLLPYKWKVDMPDGTSYRFRDTYLPDSVKIISGLQEGESWSVYVSEYEKETYDVTEVGGKQKEAENLKDPDGLDRASWNLRQEREKHRYKDAEGNTVDDYTPNAVYIEFFKSAEQTAENQGLNAPADGGDSRTITIQLKTKINKFWRDKVWERYGINAIYNGLRHENVVYANLSPEKADVIVAGLKLNKFYKGRADWIEKNKPWKGAWRFETYISGKMPGSTIVIDDYFDPDLWRFSDSSYVQFRAGVTPHYAKSVGTSNPEFWIEGEYGSKVEIVEDGHVRFTISDMPLKADGTAWPFYGTNYYLVPKDEEAWKTIQRQALEAGGIVTYVNRAESEGLTDSDTYTVELLPEFKPVVKSDPTTPDQQNMTEYTIILNQQKDRLNEGEPITMEDTFENLSIDYSTIQITTDPADRANQISYDFSGNTGYYTIPDETKVTITYKARVIPPAGTKWEGNKADVEVTNVASMLNWKDGGTQTLKVDKGAEAEIYRIRVFKYGSGHMEDGLNGAIFGLYQKNKDGTFSTINYNTSDERNGKPIRFTSGTVKMLDGLVLTDDEYNNLTESEKQQVVVRSGYALVELNNAVDGVHLDKDVDYYLKEEQVPDGYARDASVEYYSFRFGDDPDYTGEVWQYYNNDILKIRNSPTDGAFRFKKVLGGNYELSEAQKKALTFTVQKKNGEEWETVSVEVPELDNNGTQKTDRDGKPLYASVSSLTYDQVKDGISVAHIGAGTFRIVETMSSSASVPGDVSQTISFTRDEIEEDMTTAMTNEKYIEFEITQDDIDNGLEHSFEITNTYNRELVNLHARKAWLDAENHAVTPDGAKVTLGVYVKTGDTVADEPVLTVTLDGTPDDGAKDRGNVTGESAAWVAQFASLPKKNDDGNDINYVVKEVQGVTGYQVYYGKVSDDNKTTELALSASTTPVITNKQETVSFTATKTWKFLSWRDNDNCNEILGGASATLGVYYGATAEEAYAKYTSGAKAYKSVTFPDSSKTDDEQWKATFDSLPKANGTGRDYVWILVETKGYAGFTPQYGENNEKYVVLSNTEGANNNVTNVEGTQFSFSKLWKDTGQNPTGWQKDIQVTLQSRTEGTSTWKPVETYTLKVTESDTGMPVVEATGQSDPAKPCTWSVIKEENGVYSFTISGLEGASGSGEDREPLVYSVVEKQAPGYKAPAYAGANGIIFINASCAQNGQMMINIPEDSYELPSTGGYGTTRICLIGSVLIMLSGVMLIMRRRRIKS